MFPWGGDLVKMSSSSSQLKYFSTFADAVVILKMIYKQYIRITATKSKMAKFAKHKVHVGAQTLGPVG